MLDLKKQRFFHNKSCAYCGSRDMLELDKVEPGTWVTEAEWKLEGFEWYGFVLEECQVLCNPCYLRKKRVWRALENGEDVGLWLH